MKIEHEHKIEELAKVIHRYHNRDKDWQKATAFERGPYLERAEYIINAGYGLLPRISPHKVYEIAKGDVRIYKELMIAHGYLMVKTNAETTS